MFYDHDETELQINHTDLLEKFPNYLEARAGQHPHTPDSGCDLDPVCPVFAQLSAESWCISDPDPGIF